MLRISFPCPICFNTSSYPFSNACFFFLTTSREVSSMVSTMFPTCRRLLLGDQSTSTFRRNQEGPSFSTNGSISRMAKRSMDNRLIPTVNKHGWIWISDQLPEHLRRFTIFIGLRGVKRIERIPKSTLSNIFESGPRHPFVEVDILPVWFMNLIDKNLPQLYVWISYNSIGTKVVVYPICDGIEDGY